MLPARLADLSDPLPQALLLIGGGMVCLRVRRYRSALGLCLSGLLWVSLCATPAFAQWLQRGLTDRYPPVPAAHYPGAEAIVVLGGGAPMHFDGAADIDSDQVLATRAGFSLALFRAARAPRMLLSGGDEEAEAMARKLVRQGIPAAALQLETRSASTRQNALYAAAMLRRERIKRILLVTSAMHMPRALASFRNQGLSVIPAPALDLRADSRPRRPWLPQRAALRQSGRCLHEYLGLWVYRLRGWA